MLEGQECPSYDALRSLDPRIEARIRQLHPNAQPEILAVSVVEVSASYRAWLVAEVNG